MILLRALFARVVIAVVAVVAAAQLVTVPMVEAAPRTRMKVIDVEARRKSFDLSFPASHLGIKWVGDADANIEVRLQDTVDGPAADWQQLEADDDFIGKENQRSSKLISAMGAQRLDIKVTSGRVSNVELVVIDTIHGPRPLVSALNAQDAPQMNRAATAMAPAPSIITRGQWGANESIRRGSPEFAPVRKFVVHHTDTANNDPNPAATVRAIQVFHTQGRGWNDIGYNYLIDAQGRVYEGRYSRNYAAGVAPTADDGHGRGVIGAHVANYNTGSIGISLLGNFTSTSPSGATMSSLARLIGWQADRYRINPNGQTSYRNPDGSTRTSSTILGHRDLGQTSCPGGFAYDRLGGLRQDVASRMRTLYSGRTGYWVVQRNGGVANFGNAHAYGNMAGRNLNAAMRGISRTPTGRGYWLLGTDGGIFSFGNAGFYGSTGGMRLNKPVVGFEPTPTGRGYWLVASDGGIFAFGDARFFGSMGGRHLNKPVVGMAATSTGRGYWLVASDGGIFSFGDARFRGSTGSMKLVSPVVSMARSANGYWLIAADGGLFSFGAPFYGSLPSIRQVRRDVAQMGPTPTGRGYYILAADGAIYAFGDAEFQGTDLGSSSSDIAVSPVS